MELKIKDMASLTKLVEALTVNNYRVQVATVNREWPHTGIDYFAVRVDEPSRVREGEKE